MTLKNKKLLLNILAIAFLCIGMIFLLMPFLWMILTSFKTGPEAVKAPPTWFPREWHPENYVEVFKTAPFARYFVNTVIEAVGRTAVTLLVSILAAYGLSILNFHGSKYILLLFISMMMVPGEMLIIQNYITVSRFGWLDTFTGMILPMAASGMYVYMLRETFMQIPINLRKAAKIDGCSDFKYLWKIVMPNSISTISTVGLLSIISAWNGFLWPLMVTNSDAHRVLTIGLIQFNHEASSRINLQMAGSVFIILPILILYLCFRKQIIRGVAGGGIKG